MTISLSIFLATSPVFLNIPDPVISYRYSGTKLSSVGGKVTSSRINSVKDLYVSANGLGTLLAGLDLEAEITIDWAGSPQHLRPEFFTLHFLSSHENVSSRVTRSSSRSSHSTSGNPIQEAAPSEILVKVPTSGARYSFKYKVSNTVAGVAKGRTPGKITAAIDLRLEPMPKSVFSSSFGRPYTSYLDTSTGKVVASKLPPDDRMIDEKRPGRYGKGYRIDPDRVHELAAPVIQFDPKRNLETDLHVLETLGVVAFGKSWRFTNPDYLNAQLRIDYQGKKFWFYPAIALGDPRLSVSGISDSSPIIKIGEQDPIWSRPGKPGEALPRVSAEFGSSHTFEDGSSARKSEWIQWYGGQLLYHHYAVLRVRSRTGQLLEETPIIWREHLFTSPNVPPTYAHIRMGLGYDGGPLPFGN